MKEELEIQEPKFVYRDENAEKGLEKYRVFCQAKINNFDVAALGSMLETLKISEDNSVTGTRKVNLKDEKGRELFVNKIVLHDKDQKAMLNDETGLLNYYDMEKGAVVQSYVKLLLFRVWDRTVFKICALSSN